MYIQRIRGPKIEVISKWSTCHHHHPQTNTFPDHDDRDRTKTHVRHITSPGTGTLRRRIGSSQALILVIPLRPVGGEKQSGVW